MPRTTPEPFSHRDEVEKGVAVKNRAKSKGLSSLSDDSMGDLVRVLLVLGGGLTAVLAWAVGDWLPQQPARWLAGFDEFTLVWASQTLREPATIDLLIRSHVAPYVREATVVFALLGGLFGLFGGAAGGLVSRSIRRTSQASAAGLSLGLAISGATCFLVVPIQLGLILQKPDARVSIAAHALINAAAALACGIAAGLGARASVRATLTLATAGVMGGALGAMLFGLIQMCCFPFESEFTPIPQSNACRLVAFACATLIPTLCIATIFHAPSTAPADGEVGNGSV
jgi:hypothetical protein